VSFERIIVWQGGPVFLTTTESDLSRRKNVLDHSPTLATRGIFVYGTSTIHRTIFIMKMTVQSGPFSELENAYPSEISNHFPNWKGTTHPGPFFELKNDCP
jgi:hypothetical protein